MNVSEMDDFFFPKNVCKKVLIDEIWVGLDVKREQKHRNEKKKLLLFPIQQNKKRRTNPISESFNVISH